MSLLSMLESFGKSNAPTDGAPASSGLSLSSLLSGDGLAKLEADAKVFIANAEKLFGDVASSNGNVVSAIVSLASDFRTILAEVQEVKQIIADVQALIHSQGAPVVVVQAPAAPAPAALPSMHAQGIAAAVQHVAPTPAPVAQAAPSPAPADPFTPQPLAHRPLEVSEPHGGA